MIKWLDNSVGTSNMDWILLFLIDLFFGWTAILKNKNNYDAVSRLNIYIYINTVCLRHKKEYKFSESLF